MHVDPTDTPDLSALVIEGRVMDIRVPQRIPFERQTYPVPGHGGGRKARVPRTPSPPRRGATYVRSVSYFTRRNKKEIKTHPDEMEDAPKLKQTENLQKQIAAFEKLTEHANSKFSRDKFYEMLYMVSNGVPYLRGNRIQVDQAGDNGTITSVKELRELWATINGRKQRKGLQKEEESVVLKFFETFFKDLQYLKNLKAYFDERIYCVLYEYFYDPLDISVNIGGADEQTRDPETEVDSGHSSRNVSDEEKSPSTKPKRKHDTDPTPRTRFNINSIIQEIGGAAGVAKSENLPPEKQAEKERLIRSVHELYEVNRSWEAILTEENLNLAFFDPDSYHEITRYKDRTKFELVLRLVPDIFVKCYKSINLAKVWWEHAVKIYGPQPAEGAASREEGYEVRVTDIQSRASRLGEDIVREEQQIIVYENDLRKLRRRENRVVDLNDESAKIEIRKERADERYKDTVQEREQLKDLLGNTVQGTQKYNRVAMNLRDTEARLVEQYEECKLLEYHMDILKGDYNVEMEVRPSFIRFTDSLQGKITHLQKSVGEKKIEKRKCEKNLVLMKTNREKMREIMNKYVRTPSVVSVAEKSEADDTEADETAPSEGTQEIESETAESVPEKEIFLTQTAPISDRSDKRTQAAVQQRLKVLYKDYDFDDRFRPSSVASDDTEPEEFQSGNEADDETSSGLRGPYARADRGQRFDHTRPLGRQEYVMGSEKPRGSRIPRPAGNKKT